MMMMITAAVMRNRDQSRREVVEMEEVFSNTLSISMRLKRLKQEGQGEGLEEGQREKKILMRMREGLRARKG